MKTKNYLLIVLFLIILVFISTQVSVYSEGRKQYQENQYQENQQHAKFLAEEAINKMKTIPVEYSKQFEVNVLGNNSLGQSPQPDCQSPQKLCNIEQKIARELWEWEQALDGFTNQPEPYNYGCIQVLNNKIRVIVTWTESPLITPSCDDLSQSKYNHIVVNMDISKLNLSSIKPPSSVK